MNIGLIARADSTGLGVQSREFFQHIDCKALVIDFQNMIPKGSFREILKPNLEWYPGQQVFHWGEIHNLIGDIPSDVIDKFLDGLDLVFAMETPYDYNIFQACQERKIKTVLQLNYEFLDYPNRKLYTPTVFAAPSKWNWDSIPNPKVHLPVPVNTDRFKVHKTIKRFVHIVGRKADNDRNGTDTLLEALRFIKNDVEIVIRSQRPVPIPVDIIYPSNVRMTYDFGNKQEYADNYDGGVLVLPRKYGGLCLPMHEAIAAGMPVITTDISPNNTWLPDSWLVESEYAGYFKSKRLIDMNKALPEKLAEKIDQFCDETFFNTEHKRCVWLRDQISWRILKQEYLNFFETI